jgi:NAD+ kinase
MPAAVEVIKFLLGQGVTLQLHHEFANILLEHGHQVPPCHVFESPEDLLPTDLLISLGGDGTLLQTVTFAAPLGIPILGLNAGRLGFLSTMQAADIEIGWAQILAGNYALEERTLLSIDCEGKPFDDFNFALNEFTITRRDTASMLVVNTWLNGQMLNNYWADGLIISTPTGSTGYSLSCGGPLMLPDASSFIITPVSPHNLATRPIVVADSSVIEIEVEGPVERYLVSLDSRTQRVPIKTRIKISKASFTASLIQLPGESHLQTLRSKLNWGFDVRN